jgi:hypothetical protein
MRTRPGTSLVVLAALTASACATAGAVTFTGSDNPQRLSGTYRTRVDSEFHSGALNGVWRLRLGNGAYTLHYTGRSSKNAIVSGVYRAVGRRITFRDHSFACSAKPGSGGCRFLGCRHRATYTFRLTRKKLTFARVRDPDTNCELPVVLLSGTFHRFA